MIEASGPVAEWSDIDGIVEQFDDPTADKAYLQRVWLNQPVRASERAFDMTVWDALGDPAYWPPDGATISLGFDGARWHDATALVGTEIATGFVFLCGLWEKPTAIKLDEWEVDAEDVKAVVDAGVQPLGRVAHVLRPAVLGEHRGRMGREVRREAGRGVVDEPAEADGICHPVV